MIELVFEFRRKDDLRYLSHLDQQRMFQRAFRRAKFPIAYSNGFNPHPLLSFANAMSVGMSSDQEYGEIGLDIFTEELDLERMKNQLNDSLPDGIDVISLRVKEEGEASMSRRLTGASYSILCPMLKVDEKTLLSQLEDFNTQESILIQKKNKKGKLVEKDIRSHFDQLSGQKTSEGIVFDLTISAVDHSLLRPEAVLEAFFNTGGYYPSARDMKIHRTALLL